MVTAVAAASLAAVDPGVQPDGGWMINSTGAVVDRDGAAVMVDTKSTETRNRVLLAVVTASTGTPTALVNTHRHDDHTYGNWTLLSDIPIVGSA